MGASKHTLGPWEVREASYGWDVMAPREDGPSLWIAPVHGPGGPSGKLDHYPERDAVTANARLIAAAPDHAALLWAMCVGAARWDPWGVGRGEFCMNGLRYATELDPFGAPMMTGGMRAAIRIAETGER